MTPHCQLISECLRRELADYGGLLNLFEEQQRRLLERNASAVLRLADTIEDQARSVSTCRTHREEVVAAYAVSQGRPAASTLLSLLPLFSADERPLLEALVNEVNHLLRRVRRISRHNHLLIGRAVEVHQDVLQQLRPAAFTRTYSAAGQVSVAATQPASTLHRAG